jgi:hypothetical protein
MIIDCELNKKTKFKYLQQPLLYCCHDRERKRAEFEVYRRVGSLVCEYTAKET